MSLTVNLRTTGGEMQSRRFGNGVGVSIFGKAVGAFGLGEMGTAIRIEVKQGDQSLYFDTITNIFGDYSGYFRTHYLGSYTGSVKVVATYSVSGQDTEVVPFGVGTDPLPLPEPTPAAGFNLSEILKTWGTAAGVLVLVYFLVTWYLRRKGA